MQIVDIIHRHKYHIPHLDHLDYLDYIMEFAYTEEEDSFHLEDLEASDHLQIMVALRLLEETFKAFIQEEERNYPSFMDYSDFITSFDLEVIWLQHFINKD